MADGNAKDRRGNQAPEAMLPSRLAIADPRATAAIEGGTVFLGVDPRYALTFGSTSRCGRQAEARSRVAEKRTLGERSAT